MSVNTTNANKKLGFDNTMKLDFNKHWSFSTFNRMILAAYHISKLPINSRVLEIGAGTSDLKEIVKINFRRTDIEFIKIDADKQYSDDIDFIGDVTEEYIESCLDANIQINDKFNAIVMMEVVEHIGRDNVKYLLEKIYEKWLVDEGILILTTPTPPYNGTYESKVWPTDHEYEFTLLEIKALVNCKFKIIHEMSWSIEERDYYKEICDSQFLMEVKSRLEKSGFPESYIRAQIAALAPTIAGRQILMIAKARRKIE